MTSATSSFGDALDIGNEYFVVGDPAYNSSAGGAGVYAISDPSTLIQMIDPSLSAGDGFGSSVVISDQYILIGAPNKDAEKGCAYLYIKGDDETWVGYSENPIIASTRTTKDYFGCSVAINGDSLIIGAEGKNNKTGAVYIFDKNDETDLWEEGQIIIASDGKYNDQFGESLSASGDYFVTGASLVESADGEMNAGAAYVYKYGTSWYEVDKLVGVSESSYEGNHFGESVDINGDYIIVGSPYARHYGVADIFYKKRSWGHLKKIIGDDSLLDDQYGLSVSISDRFAFVGSPSESVNGAIYIFENEPVKLRLAQEFSVDQKYVPSKASMYLRRVGKNNYNYWPIYNTRKNVIDATNFSTIDYGENLIVFDDSVSGFTGNGYMNLNSDNFSTYSVVNYPIRAFVSDTFNLWIRCMSSNSSTFQADILIDGVEFRTINDVVSDPSDSKWEWIRTSIVIPDTQEHILGIRIKENGAKIDKIYIDASDSVPYSEGPCYGESPYLTVHVRVYGSIDDKPGLPLFIYDYKNSIDQIVQNDWYNFNVGVLDTSHGYILASDFIGNYFLVLSCSGNTYDNFVVWEMSDNDEYLMLPSAFKF